MKLFSVRSPQVGCRARLCLFVLVVGVVSAVHASPDRPRYSRRIHFALDQDIVFPDFTLRYTGRTHEKSPVFPPGFTYENFMVATRGREQTVRWCGGTGDIGPAEFQVGGKLFWLELGISERLGVLASDELVVSPCTRIDQPERTDERCGPDQAN